MINNILDDAIEIAKEAGTYIKSKYGKITTFKNKAEAGVADYVTTTDQEVEKLVRNSIKAKYPAHDILGEEFGNSGSLREYKWVVDPIDGTKNFLRGIPTFGTSIGVTKNGQPYIGVIYDPLTDTLAYAMKGSGAYINGKKINVLDRNIALNNSSVAINYGKTSEIREKSLSVLKELSPVVPTIRLPGSTAHSMLMVLLGTYDALIDNGDYWDFAGAIVIWQEAGGAVTDWQGKNVDEKSKFVLWSIPKLHSELLKVTSKHI